MLAKIDIQSPFTVLHSIHMARYGMGQTVSHEHNPTIPAVVHTQNFFFGADALKWALHYNCLLRHWTRYWTAVNTNSWGQAKALCLYIEWLDKEEGMYTEANAVTDRPTQPCLQSDSSRTYILLEDDLIYLANHARCGTGSTSMQSFFLICCGGKHLSTSEMAPPWWQYSICLWNQMQSSGQMLQDHCDRVAGLLGSPVVPMQVVRHTVALCHCSKGTTPHKNCLWPLGTLLEAQNSAG